MSRISQGNFKSKKGIFPIQELDLVYIRRNEKVISKTKQSVLYEYEEVVLTPFQYNSIKDKYTVDEIFTNEEEIKALKQPMTARMGAMSRAYDVVVEGYSWQDTLTPSIGKTSNITGNSYGLYTQYGVNLMNDNTTVIATGNNTVRQSIALKYGKFIPNGKKVSFSCRVNMTNNKTLSPKIYVTMNYQQYLVPPTDLINAEILLEARNYTTSNIWNEARIEIFLDNVDGSVNIYDCQLEIGGRISTYDAPKVKQMDIANIINQDNQLYNRDSVYTNDNKNIIKNNYSIIKNLGTDIGAWNEVPNTLDTLVYKTKLSDFVAFLNGSQANMKITNFANTTREALNTKEGFYYDGETTELYLSILKIRVTFTSALDFKAFLTTLGAKVILELSQPTMTTYPNVPNILTPYVNINNIIVGNAVNSESILPILTIRYVFSNVPNIYRIAFFPNETKMELIGTRGG